ncbi:hypothetical protein EV426DRAFT_720874 [Tirmania nivea]|nr:hypothetical protein EV426DRAFT_720874 [Tirmania nivea]
MRNVYILKYTYPPNIESKRCSHITQLRISTFPYIDLTMKLFSLMHPISITLLFLQFAALITAVALADTTPEPEHALIQTFKLTNAMCQRWREDTAAYKAGETYSDDAAQSAGILSLLIQHIHSTSEKLVNVKFTTLTLTAAEREGLLPLVDSMLDCASQVLVDISVVYNHVPVCGIFFKTVASVFPVLRTGGQIVLPLARRLLR